MPSRRWEIRSSGSGRVGWHKRPGTTCLRPLADSGAAFLPQNWRHDKRECWYNHNMRDRHPAKEVEAALRYAEERGWVVVRATGHTHVWAVMYCCGRSGIGTRRKGIWSTPRNPGAFARDIRRKVEGCPCFTEGEGATGWIPEPR